MSFAQKLKDYIGEIYQQDPANVIRKIQRMVDEELGIVPELAPEPPVAAVEGADVSDAILREAVELVTEPPPPEPTPDFGVPTSETGGTGGA